MMETPSSNANQNVNPTTSTTYTTNSTGSTFTWKVADRDRNRIRFGTGYLEEVDGELEWVRSDGSRSRLTGKSVNFNNLYDKLNSD